MPILLEFAHIIARLIGHLRKARSSCAGRALPRRHVPSFPRSARTLGINLGARVAVEDAGAGHPSPPPAKFSRRRYLVGSGKRY